MDDEAKESHRHIRWKLFAMGAVGALVMYCSPFLGESIRGEMIWGETIWRGLLDLAGHIGEAVVIAAVLGLTIDFSLKRQIIKDVFQASIGYVLPAEFRGELRWLYGQAILCTKHFQTMKLERLPDGHLLVRTTIQRTFKNISDKRHAADVTLGIDEWFRGDRESKIVEYGYDKDGKSETFKPLPQDLIQNASAPGWSVKKVHREVDPGQEVVSWFTIEEIHQVNGQCVDMFGTATKDPVVVVHAPDDIGVNVNYGSRARDIATKKGGTDLSAPRIVAPPSGYLCQVVGQDCGS